MILIIIIKQINYENIETGARKKFKKGQKVKGKNFKKLVFRWYFISLTLVRQEIWILTPGDVKIYGSKLVWTQIWIQT